MKKSLLVTSIDKKFVNQAKQLFSSAYFNGGWNGDYMVITNGLNQKDVNWFLKKGIIVKKYNSISKPITKIANHYPITFIRYNIFKIEFKKWRNIVFLDSDIMVQGPINNLHKLNGIYAVIDPLKFKDHFSSQNSNLLKISNYYCFNAGVFIFSTNIIKNNTFKNIILLHNKYKNLSLYNDQGILNLYFYKKWKRLPIIYNFNPYVSPKYPLNINELIKINAIIFHFFSDIIKPWNNKSPFYNKWKLNLKKSEQINLRKKIKVKNWSKRKIKKYSNIIYSDIKSSIYLTKIEKVLGKIGPKIKKINKRTYFFLKKIDPIKRIKNEMN